MIAGHWGRWCQHLAALVAGTLLPLSMAPWNLWGLGPVSLALLAWLLARHTERPFVTALFYGLGLFGVGASWVYVSIHSYGNASALLAGFLTLIFAGTLALLFALPWSLLKYCRRSAPAWILAFGALWVLGEWLRGWLFTGFPWLYVGYGQLESPLAGWIPLVGVLGAGLLAALSVAPLALAGPNKPLPANAWAGYGLALLLIWGGGQLLQGQAWTRAGASIEAALVQPDIPLMEKWDPANQQRILDRLMERSDGHWQSSLLVWPEAAVPMVGREQVEFLAELDTRARASGTALVTGRLLYEPERGTYYNSLLGLGSAAGDYHKSRLVPFGEYVPLEQYLRGLIDFFDLPSSIISMGNQSAPLELPNGVRAAAAICYEIAYADLVAAGAAQSHLILTVSNDAWFGRSIGPEQHLQIARARALENGKPVVRATNNGYSALIDHRGRITAQAERFVSLTLSGEVQLREGQTPFSRSGQLPVVITGLLMLVAAWRWRRT